MRLEMNYFIDDIPKEYDQDAYIYWLMLCELISWLVESTILWRCHSVGVLWNIEKHCTCIIVIQTRWADEVLGNHYRYIIMIYLFSRCYGGLFHKQVIMSKLFYFLYTSFMLNDQSTDSGGLKAKLQQQMYTWCSIIAYNVIQKEDHDGKNYLPQSFLLYLYGSVNIGNQAIY